MKRLILITTALFASFMFLEAQEINRGLQHHIDARSGLTICQGDNKSTSLLL